MPFKGKQEVKFPMHETQNVMLIFGDNMRGKTSFLNAIRWGFYGVALGRHLRKITRSNLINREATDEGDWTMSVSLFFDHDGRNYQLNRKIEKRENTSKPINDADFKENIGLKIDEMPITGDAIKYEINQVMPGEISRFFLFDGELLQEYENLLIEESEQGRKIKEHIESILGVPALLNARRDLQLLLKNAYTAQRKDAQKDSELVTFAQDQENLQIKQTSIENDLNKLNSQKEEFEEKIDVLEDFLKNTEAVQKRAIELDQLVANQKQLEDEIEQFNEDTLKLLKTAWKDVLTNSVKTIVDKLKEEHRRYEQTLNKYLSLQSEIVGLQKSFEDNKVCNTCGQDIPERIRQNLKEKLDKLLLKKSEENGDFEKLTEIKNTIDNLESIRSEGEIKRIVANLEKITRKKVSLIAIENKIDDIKDEIKEHDTDEIMRKREEQQRHLKILGVTESKIKENNKRREEISQKQERISQIIAKSGGVQSSISNQRVNILQQLQTIFEEGISHLRLKLKVDVEKYATTAFKRMTTEKTYSGLEINNNYGLSILDQGGRKINERSAGAEQVVALSLIDGLNKTSGTKATVVMDTPLGRLDPKHRRNIMQYLPDLSEQVVLLVHEGEINAKRDTEVFASRIGGRYEIKRVSATHSRIDKVI